MYNTKSKLKIQLYYATDNKNVDFPIEIINSRRLQHRMIKFLLPLFLARYPDIRTFKTLLSTFIIVNYIITIYERTHLWLIIKEIRFSNN